MNIKAWLVTGSRVWRDNVWLTEAGADASISERKSDDDRKVPLVDAAELSRAYALIEEVRAGLESIAKVDPGNEFSGQSGMAKKILTKTDAFLAERVK